MTEQEATRLASRIADVLFTSSGGNRAQRLVLTIDGPPRRDLGGWNQAAAMRQIARIIRAEGEGGK